jgi:DNA-directed RNA polymerase
MMIHDSFATTPNRVDDLQRLIRKVVVDLFSGDYLEELYKQFLDQLPKELHSKITPPPVRGDLDISSVEHSRYFFN